MKPTLTIGSVHYVAVPGDMPTPVKIVDSYPGDNLGAAFAGQVVYDVHFLEFDTDGHGWTVQDFVDLEA